MKNLKILTFGASNSRQSINKQLAYFAADQMAGAEITRIDLNDFEMPIYGTDREKEEGIPERAKIFRNLIEEHDAMIISFAEHNGSYSAIFKNLFDWISRIEGSTWANKPMLLMSTSPGPRGGQTVLDIAARRFPWNGGRVIDTFSLPSFHDHFDKEKGIKDPELFAQLKEKLVRFEEAVLNEALVA